VSKGIEFDTQAILKALPVIELKLGDVVDIETSVATARDIRSLRFRTTAYGSKHWKAGWHRRVVP
jgi:tartrate dehydratase beta subunit/fumarate hydratase class I family protein